VLCGGLTTTAPEGFPYRLLFHGAAALPFAVRPAYRIVDGVRQRTTRFSDVAPASLPDLPELESYHDGMVPWLADNPRLRGATVEQRTVRWPGFAAAVRLLHDAGLLDEAPVRVGDAEVAPARLTAEVLGRRIRRRPGEHEVSHLDVEVTGVLGGRTVRRTMSVSCRDTDTPLDSGLVTLTALPAIEAVAHAYRCPPGWVRPEQLFHGDQFADLQDVLKRYGAVWRDVRAEL
jgi:saccharopine dehydrogenase-like NADP-dependent oxidoreductase